MRYIAVLGFSLLLLLGVDCWAQSDGGELSQLGERFRTRRAKATSTSPSLSGLYGQTAPKIELVTEDLEAYDAERKKMLTFRATYPKGEGRCPVIAWSHGLFGSQEAYRPLVEHWAMNGYLVLQPSHSDSLQRGRGDLSKGMRGNTGDWASRPRDISFLLDQVQRIESLSPRADLTRIGIGGHSFGAHTAVLVEGAIPTLGPDYKDQRPKAFIAISPQGESRMFDSSSWAGLTRPTLFISGDNDDQPSGEKAPWRRSAFEKCPPGQKHLLWLKDAYHNFGGISGHLRAGTARTNADHVEIVKAATLAFWDSQLKSKLKASAVISNRDLGGDSRSKYTWKSR